MVIGGIAIIARGVRRMTADIDACVRGDAVDANRLLGVLARHGIEPRIDDAVAFARSNLVLLLRHRPTGVELDVSLAWSAFEHDAIDAAERAKFGAVEAPMASAEDLVVFKAVAGRPKDLEDVTALLALHPDVDIARVRARLRELAELADEPRMVDVIEAAIAASRTRPAAARATKARRSRR